MNWLTTQLDRALFVIARLEAVSLELEGTSLRVVPYPELLTIIPAQLSDSDGDGRDRQLTRDSFALLEDAAAAQVRYEQAEPSYAPLSDRYTVALDDGSGSILYLPQDSATEPETLQLFTFQPRVNHQIARIGRVHGPSRQGGHGRGSRVGRLRRRPVH